MKPSDLIDAQARAAVLKRSDEIVEDLAQKLDAAEAAAKVATKAKATRDAQTISAAERRETAELIAHRDIPFGQAAVLKGYPQVGSLFLSDGALMSSGLWRDALLSELRAVGIADPARVLELMAQNPLPPPAALPCVRRNTHYY